eukprot:9905587-Alexandrium_andersonii.AAC.1
MCIRDRSTSAGCRTASGGPERLPRAGSRMPGRACLPWHRRADAVCLACRRRVRGPCQGVVPPHPAAA